MPKSRSCFVLKITHKDGVPMSTENLTVADNMVVSMDYTLTLDSGEVIDSSDGREPLEFLHGRGQIIPGLEKELYGMTVGDMKKVSVAPAEGYGEADDDAFQVYPRSAFPDDMELTEGMALHMRDTESNQVIEAYIYEVRPDDVVLDFNHPLAGETLYFDVKIADVRHATSEELAHGHVHGAGHEH
jgi:FKBP-type peptidyl-prolyl cis-trans isomerase SlyD